MNTYFPRNLKIKSLVDLVFIPYENINLDIFLNKILEKAEDDIFEEFQQWNDSIYSMIDSAVYKLDNYDDCNDVND